MSDKGTGYLQEPSVMIKFLKTNTVYADGFNIIMKRE